MATPELKIGDVVSLPSGGPQMTVGGYVDDSDQLMCQWFDGNKINQHGFLPGALVKVDPVITPAKTP